MAAITAAAGRRQASTLAFPAVVTAALAAFLALVLPLLPRLDHDYDEGVYWLSLKSMAQGHRLFAEVFSSQPPLFLTIVAPLYHLLGGGIVGGRLAVLALAAAGILAAFDAGTSLGGRWVGLFAAAALALDPLYLRAAVILQADGPAVAWEVVAVALALRAVRPGGERRRWLAAAGAAAGVATMTKLFAVAAVVPVAGLALLIPPPGARRWPDAALDLATTLAGVAAAVALAIAPGVLAGDASAMAQQIVGMHLGGAQTAMGGTLSGNVALIGRTYAGYAVALVALPSLVAAGRRARGPRTSPADPLSGEALALLAWLLASLLLLLRQQPLWDHHVVLLVPPVCLLAALVVARAGRRGAAVVVAVAVLALGATAVEDALRPPPGLDGRTSAALARALEPVAPPGTAVVGDDAFAIALAGDQAPPDLVDQSHTRINGGALTTARAEAAMPGVTVVLEATGRLGSLPGFDAWLADHFREVPSPPGSRLWVRR